MSFLSSFGYISLTYLRQTQAELPSYLNLQTSSSLGTGKVATHQERFDKSEDKEVRRALDGRVGKRKRHDGIYTVNTPDDEDDEADEITREKKPLKEVAPVEQDSKVEFAQELVTHPEASLPRVSAVGSALQRNPDGSIVPPRRRQNARGKKVHLPLAFQRVSSSRIVSVYDQQLER